MAMALQLERSGGITAVARKPPQAYSKKSVQGSALRSSHSGTTPLSASVISLFGDGGGSALGGEAWGGTVAGGGAPAEQAQMSRAASNRGCMTGQSFSGGSPRQPTRHVRAAR